jgi:hypothetical protein
MDCETIAGAIRSRFLDFDAEVATSFLLFDLKMNEKRLSGW